MISTRGIEMVNGSDDERYTITRPAITLKGVLSMLGVLIAASRRPSMAISSIRS